MTHGRIISKLISFEHYDWLISILILPFLLPIQIVREISFDEFNLEMSLPLVYITLRRQTVKNPNRIYLTVAKYSRY